MRLNWFPRWGLEKTLLRIIEWHKLKAVEGSRKLCIAQINEYMENISNENC